MLESCVQNILKADIYGLVVETPIHKAPLLSNRFANQIFIKREDLQPVFSFKIRGAYNKLRQLNEVEKERGVITASAGNHAQGLAMAAKHMGVKAIIVMPSTTPEIKVQAVRAHGAEVFLIGDTFEEALSHTKHLISQQGYTFVPPYDDRDIIAGQGTIGMEILRQHPQKLDAIFVPVGGGGLIAGIGAYIKYLRPDIKIIGVEYEESACLKAALAARKRVILSKVGLFADGVAVAQIGKETFDICRECVDEVITVSADEICAAVKDIYDDTRAITEPSGALAVAGIKKYTDVYQVQEQSFIAINSGANVNFDRLRHIAERAEIGEGKEALLAITIKEKPGSLRKLCKILAKHSITEFNYRYHRHHSAKLFVGIQTNPKKESHKSLISYLQKHDYQVQDLTRNEVAKLHIRYMVGGHCEDLRNEKIFRFEFPERPSALLDFLETLGERWNISLFHYRNHGAAYGRILIGWSASDEESKLLEELLQKTGYRYWAETENEAYKTFLD